MSGSFSRRRLLSTALAAGKGGMKPYAWSLNGEYWPHVTPLTLSEGQRIEIDLINHSMRAHPMHLHGHAFQVIEIDEQQISGAVRDTVLVMPMSRLRIAFDADNPGDGRFTATTSTTWLPG